jgi:uncharacterized lipoprotein YehR (DUF1307 family)
MKSTTVKSILFALILSIAMSACSSHDKTATASSPTSDSIVKAKEDSATAAEARDLKEVLDAVKK